MKPSECPLPPDFFIANRTKLAEALPDNSVCALYSGEPCVRSWDQRYPFRVESNFFYLTGLTEPDCRLLIVKKGGKTTESLFIPPIDPEKEKWDGKMLTQEKAQAVSGIKTLQPRDNFDSLLFKGASYADSFCTFLNGVFPTQPLTYWHRYVENLGLRLPGMKVTNLLPTLSRLRAVKTEAEIALIKTALEHTGNALKKAAGKIKPGVFEYEIEAELLYEYQRHGLGPSFDAIVAGGVNASVLHYVENTDRLSDGGLVLIDTGALYAGYCGDLTRVFPVSGRFTDRQRQLHDANLEIQSKVIASLKVGMTLTEVGECSSTIQGEVLAREGIIQDPSAHATVTYHSIGHSLGIDVHDPLDSREPLPEGFVMTVEPGIYLPAEGIGIRNEDVVVLRSSGAELLSGSMPRTTDEIESLMVAR